MQRYNTLSAEHYKIEVHFTNSLLLTNSGLPGGWSGRVGTRKWWQMGGKISI